VTEMHIGDDVAGGVEHGIILHGAHRLYKPPQRRQPSRMTTLSRLAWRR
jgi:hypothetical protein